jgi:hypothetical protein
MEYLTIEQRKEIARTIRSNCATLQEIANCIEDKENVIDSNCALGGTVGILKIISEKMQAATEKEYESKKLINILK